VQHRAYGISLNRTGGGQAGFAEWPDPPVTDCQGGRAVRDGEPKTVRLTDPEFDGSIPIGLNRRASIDQKNMFLAELFSGIIDCKPRRRDCPPAAAVAGFPALPIRAAQHDKMDKA
jgi:hypothetical protein